MYRGIFVDGKIKNPKTGRVLDLRLVGDGENENMPYLQSVSIQSGYGVDMRMSITLAPPYEKALEFMSKDQEWFRLGNIMALRWGYSDIDGAISDWHMGFMLLPEADFGEEITITIPAVSQGFTAARVARLRVWSSHENRRTFKSVAEEIAKHYGMTVEFGLMTEKRRKLLMTDKRADLVQGGRTDIQFLLFEALKRAGVRMVIRNDKFIFVDENSPLESERDVLATFQMYGRMDPWNAVYPMTSFSPESMGTLFMQGHQGTAFFGGDPNSDPEADVEGTVITGDESDLNMYSGDRTVDAKTEEGAPAGLTNSDGTVNGAKATVVADIEQMAAGRFVFPEASEKGENFIREEIGAARDSDASDEGLAVNFSSPVALPFLIPGMYVRLAGVGDYFSTTYMLHERDVTISDGGAEMTCVARSMGYSGFSEELDPFSQPAKKHDEPVDGEPRLVPVDPNPYEGE